VGGWSGCKGKGKGKMAYVHYFKDIRQGTLQSDCVMLLGVGMTRFGGLG